MPESVFVFTQRDGAMRGYVVAPSIWLALEALSRYHAYAACEIDVTRNRVKDTDYWVVVVKQGVWSVVFDVKAISACGEFVVITRGGETTDVS